MGGPNVIKNFAFGNHFPQIDEPLITVIPGDLEHALKNRLCGYNAKNVIHGILSSEKKVLLGLPLGITPERIRTQIDGVFLIIQPIDRMPIFTKLRLVEI